MGDDAGERGGTVGWGDMLTQPNRARLGASTRSGGRVTDQLLIMGSRGYWKLRILANGTSSSSSLRSYAHQRQRLQFLGLFAGEVRQGQHRHCYRKRQCDEDGGAIAFR